MHRKHCTKCRSKKSPFSPTQFSYIHCQPERQEPNSGSATRCSKIENQDLYVHFIMQGTKHSAINQVMQNQGEETKYIFIWETFI